MDAEGGNDTNSGTSPAAAWHSLAHASAQTFAPGDQILLQRGDTFLGTLILDNESGTQAEPIIVGAYGTGDLPVIDAAGYLAGVNIRDVEYIEVQDLEITSNGGPVLDGSAGLAEKDEWNADKARYGVYVNGITGTAVGHVTLRNLYIHDIFPTSDRATEGANPTTSYTVSGLDLSRYGGAFGETLVFDVTYTQTGGTEVVFNSTGRVGVANITGLDSQIDENEALTAAVDFNEGASTFSGDFANLSIGFTRVAPGGVNDGETWEVTHGSAPTTISRAYSSRIATFASSDYFTISNVSGAMNLGAVDVEIVDIPEPSFCAALLGLGCLTLILRRRQ